MCFLLQCEGKSLQEIENEAAVTILGLKKDSYVEW
jgi:hypothetical protein